jgi:hypothetical protein
VLALIAAAVPRSMTTLWPLKELDDEPAKLLGRDDLVAPTVTSKVVAVVAGPSPLPVAHEPTNRNR